METMLMVFCRTKLDFISVKCKKKWNQNGDYDYPGDFFHAKNKSQEDPGADSNAWNEVCEVLSLLQWHQIIGCLKFVFQKFSPQLYGLTLVILLK